MDEALITALLQMKPLNLKPYRVVESQHYISTRRLVSSEQEQALLEQILDQSKPARATRNKRGKLHYLLYTPFRYPPLKHGSRFGSYLEPSLFYASLELETAMAEVAYHKFVDNHATQAALTPCEIGFTHFRVHIATPKGLDLTDKRFNSFQTKISNKHSYLYAQKLGNAMRQAGAEAFVFLSARRPPGKNIGLFNVEAFADNKPIEQRDWKVFVSKEAVEFFSHDSRAVRFKVEDFMTDGVVDFVREA